MSTANEMDQAGEEERRDNYVEFSKTPNGNNGTTSIDVSEGAELTVGHSTNPSTNATAAAIAQSNASTPESCQSPSPQQSASQTLSVKANQQSAADLHSDPDSTYELTKVDIIMHSSPPPHSYRNSRGYRHFKNPPQPHMCIRTTNEAGEELFINVLSWTRIVIPQEPTDPIPLYGGMRVPPGSPRSPPLVFAVMANPEVLKDAGRHSKDPEERRAMVELMCDFVEAMNPGVKLVRNAVILKDRDISGELKDVWNAVQAQRDREREEQFMLQRQQQQQAQAANGQQAQQPPQQQLTFPKPANALNAQPATGGNCKYPGEAYVELAVFPSEQTDVPKDTSEQDKPTPKVETSATNGSLPKAEPTSESTDQIDAVVASAEESKAAPATATPTPTPNNSTTTTVIKEKKEKLGGFLPNGCIFPRFKQNKHKDKDNKESSKGKEKTLLQALKKSKDKNKSTTSNDKNIIAKIECDMQKLDINEIETSTNNREHILMKLNLSSHSPAATAAK